MTQNVVFTSIKYVVVELIGDLLYWPVWWYTKGFLKVANYFWQSIVSQEKRLGLNIWITNIFKPMFAQYDWQGRIISFFIRLIQIIFRAVAMLVWLGIILVLFLVWLLLPIFLVYQIWSNLYWLLII